MLVFWRTTRFVNLPRACSDVCDGGDARWVQVSWEETSFYLDKDFVLPFHSINLADIIVVENVMIEVCSHALVVCLLSCTIRRICWIVYKD